MNLKNYHPNLQLPSALRSFIVSFISLFSCLAHNSTVLVQSHCSLGICRPQQTAVCSEKALKTHCARYFLKSQLKSQIFPSKVEPRDQKQGWKSVNIRLTFTRWPETHLQMSDHVVKQLFANKFAISTCDMSDERSLFTTCFHCPKWPKKSVVAVFSSVTKVLSATCTNSIKSKSTH